MAAKRDKKGFMPNVPKAKSRTIIWSSQIGKKKEADDRKCLQSKDKSPGIYSSAYYLLNRRFMDQNTSSRI